MALGVYVHQQATEQQRQHAIDLIKEDKLEKAAEYLKKITKCVHLGRFWTGHRFKFAINPDFYDVNSLATIKSYLSMPYVKIVIDEVGEVSVDEFWKMFEREQNKMAETDYNNKVTAEGISYNDRDADSWFN